MRDGWPPLGWGYSLREEQLWTPRRIAAQVRAALVGAELRAGRHAHTVLADGHALDSGFVACNERNYPECLELMRDRPLDPTRPLNRTLLV
ncbi:MAG: hypothetical protein M3Q31_13845 [Actinomycetota bacterium]|nr:hypothetical protein [Actinomycetota bacterium]